LPIARNDTAAAGDGTLWDDPGFSARPRTGKEGRIAVTKMRFSTKLGIAGLSTGAVLKAVSAGFAVPLDMPTEGPIANVSPSSVEAAISIQLLSRAALATGIVALLYALYKRLRHEPDAEPAPAILPQRLSLGAEFLVVLGIVAVLFAVNLVTAEIYPMAWLDEAGYADPAINLARGNGLTSSVWYNSIWGKLWVSYPPLYPVLLAPWIRWLGANFTTIRMFNVVLISATAIALWHYTVRSGWFPSLLGRLIVVLLPLLGYGVSFTYRSARPDTLCILLAALALNASLLPNRRWRATALVAIGVLVPWSGLQLPAFAVVLALLIGIWWPRQAVMLFLPLGIGMALGLVALFGFYAVNHSLYEFIAATFASLHTIIGEIVHLVVLHEQRGMDHFAQLPELLPAVVFEDRSSVFVAAAAVLLLVSLRHNRDTAAFRASRFAVAAAIVIPIFMEIAGNYWLYYTWMGLLTVGIAAVASLGSLPSSPTHRPVRRTAIGCIGLALLVGLPAQLARAYDERGARDYDAVRDYVRARVAPGDWVYVSDEPYFAVVEQGAVPVLALYATSRLAPGIPEDQRRRIKLLIVRPDEVNDAIKRLGGSWVPSGPALSPPLSTRLGWGEWWSYRLVAYRQG
jgi:hypothetical protein